MRLLLDQNLSSRLPARLGLIYPGMIHVSDLGLSTASDEEVWDAALLDFLRRALLQAAPLREPEDLAALLALGPALDANHRAQAGA